MDSHLGIENPLSILFFPWHIHRLDFAFLWQVKLVVLRTSPEDCSCPSGHSHEYFSGKCLLSRQAIRWCCSTALWLVNYAGFEMWKLPYMQLARWLHNWSPTTMTYAYNQMASSFLHWNAYDSPKQENPLPPCVEPLPMELTELAVQVCHASNMDKDTCIADMINIVLTFMSPLWTHRDFWQHNIQVVKYQVLPKQQTCTHTVLWAFVHNWHSYPNV